MVPESPGPGLWAGSDPEGGPTTPPLPPSPHPAEARASVATTSAKAHRRLMAFGA